MLIVGEKINMTRSPVAEAWQARDAGFVARLAREQAEAGAAYIDVNGGVYGEEVECMEWLVSIVQDAVDLPLSIDTTHPGALERALGLVKKTPMVNSVSCEKARREAFLPLLRGRDCKVVALLMSDQGVPKSAQERVHNAEGLMEDLLRQGLDAEQIFIDPCVVPVASDPGAGAAVLEALPLIKQRWPAAHLIAGISNVSYGLPLRGLLNRTFLVMCMAAGLDAAIVDPTDPGIRSAVLAGRAVLGQDPYCTDYLTWFRKGVRG